MEGLDIEEDIVNGFSFLSFRTVEELEQCGEAEKRQPPVLKPQSKKTVSRSQKCGRHPPVLCSFSNFSYSFSKDVTIRECVPTQRQTPPKKRGRPRKGSAKKSGTPRKELNSNTVRVVDKSCTRTGNTPGFFEYNFADAAHSFDIALPEKMNSSESSPKNLNTCSKPSATISMSQAIGATLALNPPEAKENSRDSFSNSDITDNSLVKFPKADGNLRTVTENLQMEHQIPNVSPAEPQALNAGPNAIAENSQMGHQVLNGIPAIAENPQTKTPTQSVNQAAVAENSQTEPQTLNVDPAVADNSVADTQTMNGIPAVSTSSQEDPQIVNGIPAKNAQVDSPILDVHRAESVIPAVHPAENLQVESPILATKPAQTEYPILNVQPAKIAQAESSTLDAHPAENAQAESSTLDANPARNAQALTPTLDANPAENAQAETSILDAHPAENTPAETSTLDAENAQAETSTMDANPAENAQAETSTLDANSAENAPVETSTLDAHPAENAPVETSTRDADPAENTPAETSTLDAENAQAKTSTMDAKPTENAQAETSTLDANPAENAQAKTSTLDANPAENAQAETSTLDAHPAENAPVETSTLDAHPAGNAQAESSTLDANPARNAQAVTPTLDANPAENAQAETSILDAHPAENTPAETSTLDAENSQAETSTLNANPAENAQAETSTLNANPAENAQAGTSTLDAHPAENAPVETSTLDANPAENTPAETSTLDADPAENTQAETSTLDAHPAENAPVETPTPDADPAENTPAETSTLDAENAQAKTSTMDAKPTENAQAKTSTLDANPAENAQAETSTLDANPAENAQAETSTLDANSVENAQAETLTLDAHPAENAEASKLDGHPAEVAQHSKADAKVLKPIQDEILKASPAMNSQEDNHKLDAGSVGGAENSQVDPGMGEVIQSARSGDFQLSPKAQKSDQIEPSNNLLSSPSTAVTKQTVASKEIIKQSELGANTQMKQPDVSETTITNHPSFGAKEAERTENTSAKTVSDISDNTNKLKIVEPKIIYSRNKNLQISEVGRSQITSFQTPVSSAPKVTSGFNENPIKRADLQVVLTDIGSLFNECAAARVETESNLSKEKNDSNSTARTDTAQNKLPKVHENVNSTTEKNVQSSGSVTPQSTKKVAILEPPEDWGALVDFSFLNTRMTSHSTPPVSKVELHQKKVQTPEKQGKMSPVRKEREQNGLSGVLTVSEAMTICRQIVDEVVCLAVQQATAPKEPSKIFASKNQTTSTKVDNHMDENILKLTNGSIEAPVSAQECKEKSVSAPRETKGVSTTASEQVPSVTIKTEKPEPKPKESRVPATAKQPKPNKVNGVAKERSNIPATSKKAASVSTQKNGESDILSALGIKIEVAEKENNVVEVKQEPSHPSVPTCNGSENVARKVLSANETRVTVIHPDKTKSKQTDKESKEKSPVIEVSSSQNASSSCSSENEDVINREKLRDKLKGWKGSFINLRKRAKTTAPTEVEMTKRQRIEEEDSMGQQPVESNEEGLSMAQFLNSPENSAYLQEKRRLEQQITELKKELCTEKGKSKSLRRSVQEFELATAKAEHKFRLADLDLDEFKVKYETATKEIESLQASLMYEAQDYKAVAEYQNLQDLNQEVNDLKEKMTFKDMKLSVLQSKAEEIAKLKIEQAGMKTEYDKTMSGCNKRLQDLNDKLSDEEKLRNELEVKVKEEVEKFRDLELENIKLTDKMNDAKNEAESLKKRSDQQTENREKMNNIRPLLGGSISLMIKSGFKYNTAIIIEGFITATADDYSTCLAHITETVLKCDSDEFDKSKRYSRSSRDHSRGSKDDRYHKHKKKRHAVRSPKRHDKRRRRDVDDESSFSSDSAPELRGSRDRVSDAEISHVRSLLIGSISLMFKNGLSYQNSLRIQGVLGITIDKQQKLYLVLDETVADSLSEKNSNSRENSRPASQPGKQANGAKQNGSENRRNGSTTPSGRIDNRRDSQVIEIMDDEDVTSRDRPVPIGQVYGFVPPSTIRFPEQPLYCSTPAPNIRNDTQTTNRNRKKRAPQENSCPICDTQFMTECSLDVHMRNAHGQSRIAPLGLQGQGRMISPNFVRMTSPPIGQGRQRMMSPIAPNRAPPEMRFSQPAARNVRPVVRPHPVSGNFPNVVNVRRQLYPDRPPPMATVSRIRGRLPYNTNSVRLTTVVKRKADFVTID